MKTIKVKCRQCGFETTNNPEEILPPEVASIETNFCPHCDKEGEYYEEYFLDADGKEILGDSSKQAVKKDFYCSQTYHNENRCLEQCAACYEFEKP